MNRQEQIEYCDNCIHTGYHPDKGVICGLNGKVPNLKDACSEFAINPNLERYQNWKDEEKKMTSNRPGLWTQDEEGSFYRINKPRLIFGILLFSSSIGLIIYEYFNGHFAEALAIYGLSILVGLKLMSKSLTPME